MLRTKPAARSYQGSSTILRTVQTAYASSITVPLRYPIKPDDRFLPNGLQSQIQWDYQSYGFPWDPVTDNVTEATGIRLWAGGSWATAEEDC